MTAIDNKKKKDKIHWIKKKSLFIFCYMILSIVHRGLSGQGLY